MLPDDYIIQILGPANHCRVHLATKVRGKVGAMLAMLVLWANRTASLERLTAVLWGHLPPRSATANLRTYPHALHDRLAGGPAALDEERRRTVESLAEARISLGEACLAAREVIDRIWPVGDGMLACPGLRLLYRSVGGAHWAHLSIA